VTKRIAMTAALAVTTIAVPMASAHIAISSGPGFADKTQEVSFGVGHGCANADTLSVRVQLPAEVTSVRAVNSDLGRARIEKNTAGLVTAVIWSKPPAEIVEGDPNYYRLTLRLRVPNKPFTTLYFPTIQTCRTPAGVETTAEWISTGAGSGHDAGPADAAEPEPAPALVIVPARQPGWNKFTVPAAMTDLATYFGDAQIVWVGSAAYSPNTSTADLIKTEPGTQPLASIPAGSVVWVKY
jgi:periplasmic copper chaperone A